MANQSLLNAKHFQARLVLIALARYIVFHVESLLAKPTETEIKIHATKKNIQLHSSGQNG